MNSNPSDQRPTSGFSLIEVVIATGLFAFAVVTLLALLPMAARQAAGSQDLQTAAHLADAVRLETQRQVPPAAFAGFMSLRLVAARDGTRVRLLDVADPDPDRYFFIEVDPYGQAPLQFVPASPLLVLTARVSWPFQPAGSAPVAGNATFAARETLSFVFGLRP